MCDRFFRPRERRSGQAANTKMQRFIERHRWFEQKLNYINAIQLQKARREAIAVCV